MDENQVKYLEKICSLYRTGIYLEGIDEIVFYEEYRNNKKLKNL